MSRTVSEANLGGLLNMERRIRLAESLQSKEKGSDNGGVRIEKRAVDIPDQILDHERPLRLERMDGRCVAEHLI